MSFRVDFTKTSENGYVLTGGYYFSFDDEFVIDGVSYSTTSETDAIVTLQDPDGNYVWVKTVSSGGLDLIRSGSFSEDGSVIITGDFNVRPTDPNEVVQFGDFELTGSGDVFAAKIDLNGEVAWAKTLVGGEGTQFTQPNSQVKLSDGTFISVTYYKDSALSEDTLIEEPFNNPGSGIILTKFDSSGNILWNQTVDPSGFDSGNISYPVLEPISGGKFILRGEFRRSLVVDDITINQIFGIGDPGSQFAVLFDSDGSALTGNIGTEIEDTSFFGPQINTTIKSDILDPFNITGGELGAYALYTFSEGDIVTDSLLSKPETSFLTNYEDSTSQYVFQGSDLLNLYQSTDGDTLSLENVSFNTFDSVAGQIVELTGTYDAASDTYTVETGGSNFVNINFDVTDGSGVPYARQELTASDESLVLEGVEGVSYFYAQDQVNDNNAWDKKGYTEDGDYWVKVKNSSDSLIGDAQEIALVMGSDDILTGGNVAQADIVNGLANGDLISTKSWYSYDGTFNFAKFDAADVDSLVQSGDTLRIARIDANTGEQIGGAQAFRADLTFDKFATAFDRSLSNQNDFQYGEILESQTGGF